MQIPIKYNIRTLFVRRGNTLMTIASIAFVVLVYVGVLSLAAGLRASLGSKGDAANVIVLRDGARAETESYFEKDKFRILSTLPGIATGPSGEPLASGELVILQILKRSDGSESNVALRGVDEVAFLLRPAFKIVEGRQFRPGVGEIIVGRRLAERFPGLALGKQIKLGRLEFTVVGTFDSGGTFDSEVWGASDDLGNAFRRENTYSSVLVRTGSPDEAEALIAQIEGDQRLKLSAETEPAYFKEQTTATSQQFVVLGNALAILMGFGACFAAANTMYSHVAARAREIGTLRALGFRRRSILGAFVFEAAILGLVAGVIGVVLALPLNGVSTGTTNFLTFSEVTFGLRTGPQEMIGGVLLAVLTGVIGGLPPAVSAARREITALLRER
ncbi:MAG: ABC transporter permease [Candidatus Eisenbacteria bacterium]|uniref:ABC transporter permease n=1 Tax=Eiseniibacteriota bacterium TaxID=2212470 RepID=A0A956RNP0_UNCEI|nr:ABC transporter permease [Candidatus Eisenbacteria bacterium]